MTPVVVIWKDAHADAEGWAEPSDIDDEPYLIRSAGFLLSRGQGKKKGHVSIAQSISADNMIDSILHIPKKMVISVATLDTEGAKDGETADQSRSIGGHPVPENRKAPRVR